MDPSKKNLYALITGAGFALLFLLFGFRLYDTGSLNTAPLGPVGVAGAIVVTGSTWGVNFGSSLKKGEHYTKFVLLSSFFLTLILAIVAYTVYSIIELHQTFDGPFNLGLLAVSMIPTTFALHTGLTDETNLKKIIDGFSTKVSPALLSGYAAATVFDVPIGLGVGVTVGLGWGLLPPIARKLWKEWHGEGLGVTEM
jgi:hypothetical protein